MAPANGPYSGGLSTLVAGGVVFGIIAIITVLISGGVRPASGAEADADTTAVPSPRGAMVRSLVLPGWGQFYNRRKVKGVVIAAAEVGSAVAFFVRRNDLRKNRIPGQASERNVFLFTTLGVIFYSMVDAYVDAHLDGVAWGEIEADLRRKEKVLRVILRVRF